MVSERHFGDKIRNMRIERGLKLRQVAPEIGVSMMFLSELESGAKYPTAERLDALARFYEVEVGMLASLVARQRTSNEASKGPEGDIQLEAARRVLDMDEAQVGALLDWLDVRQKK